MRSSLPGTTNVRPALIKIRKNMIKHPYENHFLCLLEEEPKPNTITEAKFIRQSYEAEPTANSHSNTLEKTHQVDSPIHVELTISIKTDRVHRIKSTIFINTVTYSYKTTKPIGGDFASCLPIKQKRKRKHKHQSI